MGRSGAPPEDEFWTAKVAVLEVMSATMQPQWFGPGMENTLTIGLKATQAGSRNGGASPAVKEMAPNGLLVLDAPLHFDLSGCRLNQGPAPQRWAAMLSIASTCTVSQTPRQHTRGTAQNRATLLMNGWLKAGVTYEFQFVVTNPLGQVGDADEIDGFFLWTQHSSTGPLDSTAAPMGILKDQTESWQIYPETWAEVPSLEVLGGALKPFSTFGLVEHMTIKGLRRGRWRLTAPAEVRFQRPTKVLAMGGQRVSRRLQQSLADFCQTKDASTLEIDVSYSFEVVFEVIVPTAVHAVRNFFLEMNPGDLTMAPRGARRYVAPPLRLVQAAVQCSSSHIGDPFTVITFMVQLPVALPKDGYLLIQADSALPGLGLTCPMVAETIEESMPLPEGTTCEVLVGRSGSLAWRLDGAWAAGLYALRGQAGSVSGIAWTVGTYQQGGMWEVPLDTPAFVPGCFLSKLLPSTLNVSAVNRKPRHSTEVFFTFQVPETVPAGSALTVHTPTGYELQADCSAALIGSNESTWLGRCIAQGESVEVVNPASQPSRNWWILALQGFSSKPLDGYPLAQIQFPQPLHAINQGCGLDIFTPVGISFVLQQMLPAQGSLNIMAPVGHVLDEVISLSSVVASLTAQVETKSQNMATVRVTTELEAGTTYSLYIFALNPATVPSESSERYWTLESKEPSGRTLDQGEVKSFQLLPAADLQVVNLGQDYSNQDIRVNFSARLPMPVLFGDLVLFQAPPGFPLEDFQWPHGGEVEEVPVPVANISCHFGPCILALSFTGSWQLQQILNSVAYGAMKTISFSMSSRNPAARGTTELDWWSVEHFRVMTLSKAVVRSWRTRPELQSAMVQLLGPSLAALSVSTLRLSFVPESPAVALRLVAHDPPDVSFANAGVQAPQAPAGPQELRLSGLSLVPGVEAVLVITSVQLGRGGGQSIFSLQTFRSSSFEEGVVDERLRFAGFYQAGSVEVQGHLEGEHTTATDAWLRQLPPRAAERGLITLTLVFSMALLRGDVLMITCQGLGAYELFGHSLVMTSRGFDLGAGEVIAVEAQNQGIHQVSILLSNASSNATQGDLTVIQAAQFAQLQFQAIPTAEANTWKVDSYSHNVLSNTNDGTFAGFQPVLQLLVELAPLRSPPNARISVNLQVSTSASPRMTQLNLVAPPGFSFPTLCGDFCASFGEFFEDTGRAMATLSSSASLLGQQLLFEVFTPITTPQVLTWLLRGYGPSGELQGWGIAPGFKVNQMIAELWYGGVPGLRTAELAMVFTLDVATLAASQAANLRIVEVQAPSVFELSCDGNSLKQLNLPQAECVLEGLGGVRLELADSLITGTYAFSVTAELPPVTPPQNHFSIIIRQQPTENVVDAAFGLPGWPIIDIDSSQPILAWTTAQLGEVSSVTISFTMQNATGALRAFLINLPEFYQHRIRGPSEFKVSNPRLPLLKGASDWLDVSQLDRIRVNLEPEDPVVAVGSYLFTFPVALPLPSSPLPSVNLWRLSFCRARSCEVLVSFPIGGFAPGEVSALEQRRQEWARQGSVPETTASAPPSYSWAWTLIILLGT
eukprot:symbB.v1.2.007479.t1/scaffold410.1/size210127/6